MIKKCFSWLLLLLIGISMALLFWCAVQSSIPSHSKVEAILSPYVYEHQYDEYLREGKQVSVFVDYIRNAETGEKASLYPYTHFNADCVLPMTTDELGCFMIRNVRYQYFLGNGRFEIVATEFYSNEHWRTLYVENGKIYERCLDKHWPFNGRTEICELQTPTMFYDPISISGLDGCGVLLFSGDDPGIESDFSVFIHTKKGWQKAKFLMPSGDEEEYLQGYVRRRVDDTAHDSTSRDVGTMEVCTKNQDGEYSIYRVIYNGPTLALEADADGVVSSEDLLCWTY